MRKGISVVSVTYNEEKYIRDSILALKNYVDDFVVIDQESTDKTVEIALELTDKVYIFPRVYYPYAYIHEASLMADNDWILKLDPDERWNHNLASCLPSLVNTYYDIVKFRMMINGVVNKEAYHPRMYRKSRVLWTDSLDARPIVKSGLLREYNFPVGNIVHLKDISISNSRYRKEASKRLLVRCEGTRLPVYQSLCRYYEEIIKTK